MTKTEEWPFTGALDMNAPVLLADSIVENLDGFPLWLNGQSPAVKNTLVWT